MPTLTISHCLGTLQDEPDQAQAFEGIRDALASGDPARTGPEPLALIDAARQTHAHRGESETVARLIEIEVEFLGHDPDRQAALLRELGQLRHEDLLDDKGARGAYERALALRPGDADLQDALTGLEAIPGRWKESAKTYVDQAEGATDPNLKSSLLARAATLVWQYKKKGRDKDVDGLFAEALRIDPSNTRAARLYERTLRDRERWGDVAAVLLAAAESARNRDERLHLFIRAGRLFSKALGDKDRATTCYERALDLSPGLPEAMAWLAGYFTEQEAWDHLVSLYEDALRARQKPESEQGTLLQIGMVHWRMRGRPDAAEPYFARLRKIDPAHPAVIEFYKEHLGKAGDEARLLTILHDAQRTTTDPKSKLALALEVARGATAGAAPADRAIDAWKAVHRLDPSNGEAVAALKDLYERSGKWNALVDVLKADLEAAPAADSNKRLSILRDLVGIYRDKLHLDPMVVQTYGAILQLAPDDEDALAALASVYESMQRWNDLIHVLVKQAALATSDDEKIALLMRVATLWIGKFTNFNQATAPLEQVLEIDPENRDAIAHLKEIYSKRRAWQPLYAVLQKEVGLTSDSRARIELQVELAKIAGERLHKNADAAALWETIVAEDATTPGALDALEKLAEKERDWPRLGKALELRLSQTESAEERVKTLQKIGAVFSSDQGNDPARAAAAWKRILEIDPKNARALRTLRETFLAAGDWAELEALYRDVGDWEGLAEVLGSAADRAADRALKIQLSFRVAEIYENELREPARAFRAYERVLAVEPRNLRAATALSALYERDQKWSRLAPLLEVRLAAVAQDDVAERLRLIGRLRALSSEELRDPEAGLRWAAEAYALAPEDAEERAALENAAERAVAFGRLAEVYTRRLEVAGASEALWLRRRIASLASEKLGRSDDAIAQLRRVLEENPRDEEAAESLDRVFRAEKRWSDLRDLFLFRIERADDATARMLLLSDLAEVEENYLSDPSSAATRYRAVLEIDPDETGALAALERLAEEGQRWTELAEILRRTRDLASTGPERIGITLRLGSVLYERVLDIDGALAAFEDVLAQGEGGAAESEAVSALEKLAAEHPDKAVAAGRLLEPAYEAREAWEKLDSVLTARLPTLTDAADKRTLQLRLADLKAGRLSDPAGAYSALEAAFLDDPSDRDLWDRLSDAADAARRPEALVAAYALALETAPLSDTEVSELASRIARLYDDVLGRPEEAEKFHRKVLSHDPMDEAAFSALKDFYTNQERWDDLQVLYRNRIAQTVDAAAKLDLLLQVCFLFEELLSDPQLAIRAYQDVLELRPENETARRALERLFTDTERWRDLAAHLETELGTPDVDAIAVTFRLALVYEQKLSEYRQAVDQLESVLAMDPVHEGAREALERMLVQPGERQRIAAALEPVHERRAGWDDLARILSVQLEAVRDVASRVELLTRIAELRENRLGDTEKAFSAWSEAVLADPTDTRARQELARLSAVRDAEKERAAVLERALEKTDSASLRAELLGELAALWDERSPDPQRAEDAYERLIAADPDDHDTILRASRALERIHAQKGDTKKLVVDLQRQIAIEPDVGIQKRQLTRLAELLETDLGDLEGAVAAHQARVEFDPADVDALRALERLFERLGKWTDLIGALRQREGVTEDPEERRALLRRVADVYDERLSDPDAAIAAYNDLTAAFGPSRDVSARLARLHAQTEAWDDLLETLRGELALGLDPHEQAEIRFRIAELMRTKTNDLPGAIDGYAEVLRALPDHAGTAAALAQIAHDPSIAIDERVHAARELLPGYEARSEFSSLVKILDVLALSEDPAEKRASLEKAAYVAESGLADPARAFDFMGRALKASDGDRAPLVVELDRLASASGRSSDMALLLMEVAPDIADGDEQADIHRRIASIADSRLQDPETARAYYVKVLEQLPDDVATLDALDDLYGRLGDDRARAQIVSTKASLATDPTQRGQLLLRLAEIAETRLADTSGAIDANEQLLADGDPPEAYVSLERLYTKAERFSDLVALFERQIDRRLFDVAEAHFNLGETYRARLSEPSMAIAQYASALGLSPQHPGAVGALETILETEGEPAVSAAEILEPVYLVRFEWPKVIHVLEVRLSAEQDPEERRKLLTRLAEIHEVQREDLRAALDIYARLLHENVADEAVWESITRLGRAGGDWDRVAAIFHAELEIAGVQDETLARLAIYVGKIDEEKRSDFAKAAASYRSVLSFDPMHPEAFQLVENAYQRLGDQGALLTLYRERSEVADEASRLALLHRIAEIRQAEEAGYPAAIEVYREILEGTPADERALVALDRLLVAEKRWQDLVEHLRLRIDHASDETTDLELRYRLGETLGVRLSDKEAAIDTYEEILRRDPHHRAAIGALEILQTDSSVRLRVLQILEPIYAASDAWTKLVEARSARIELASDPVEKIEILGDVARLYEERAGDGPAAFSAWSRALEIDPGRDDVREEVERVATKYALWDRWVETFEKAIQNTDDQVVVSRLLSTMARVHDERRGDPRSSIETYERLLKHDDTDETVLDALEALHTMVGDWHGLVEVLRRKSERAIAPAERGELFRRAGGVLEELLGDREGAIDVYRKALEENDADEFALESLDRLLSSASDAAGLFQVLKRRAELSTAPEERAELSLRLGVIAEERLARPDDAIEAFQAALIDQPGSRTAIDALSRLYERQGLWPELLENLKLQAGVEADSARRGLLLYRAGEILERELEDAAEALEMYREALNSDPRAEPPRTALMRMTRLEDHRAAATEILEPLLLAQGKFDDLSIVIERRAEGASDPSEKQREFRRLAELQEHQRGNLEGAFEAYRRALLEDPLDADILDQLARIAPTLSAWDRLADIFAARASTVLDARDAQGLYLRLARLAETNLSDDARAIDAYERAAQQIGDDVSILSSLDALHTKGKDWPSLSTILERRIAIESDDALWMEAANRLGSLRAQRFGDIRGAFSMYRDVLERDPANETALSAMEALSAESGVTSEALDVLDAAYKRSGAFDRAASVLERRAELAETAQEQSRLLQDVAAFYEQELRQPSRALGAMKRAFERDPSDVDVSVHLERLAEATGSWDALRGLVEAIVDKSDLDRGARRDLHVRAAGWYRERLGDLGAAEVQLRAAIAADKDATDAYTQLAALLRDTARYAELVPLLRAWADVETDDTERAAKMREAGALAEERLGDVATAAECYAALLRIDTSDVDALTALIRIRKSEGAWKEVAGLLDKRIDAEPDAATRLSLRHELARLWRERLSDDEESIRAFRAALDEAPSDLQAIAALEDLFENAARWNDYQEMIERRLDLAESAAERATAKVRLARLTEQRFGKRDEAIAQLRDVLSDDPVNADALAELERLLKASGRWDEVAELLRSRAGEAASRGDFAEESAVLVRLADITESELGEPSQAASIHERLLVRDPSRVESLSALARIQGAAGAWPEVASALERLLGVQTGADKAGTAHTLADVYENRLGDADRAHTILQSVLDEGGAETEAQLKALYERRGMFAPLVDLLDRQLASLPDATARAQALRHLAALSSEKLGDPARAVGYLEAASQIAPDDRELALLLCDTYVAAGREHDAIPVLERIIAGYGGKRQKEVAQLHHRLGIARERTGDLAGAMSHFEAANKIDLTSIAIQRDYGKLAYRQGDFATAQKMFRALLLQKIDASHGITKAEVYFYIADISAKTGDKPKAISMLDRALAEDKNHIASKELLASLKGP